MPRAALEAALLAAHASGDRRALVGLYAQAADGAPSPAAAAFYLTQAYVLALDTAHPEAPRLHARLKAEGREA
jgi:hypothetical protein